MTFKEANLKCINRRIIQLLTNMINTQFQMVTIIMIKKININNKKYYYKLS